MTSTARGMGSVGAGGLLDEPFSLALVLLKSRLDSEPSGTGTSDPSTSSGMDIRGGDDAVGGGLTPLPLSAESDPAIATGSNAAAAAPLSVIPEIQ